MNVFYEVLSNGAYPVFTLNSEKTPVTLNGYINRRDQKYNQEDIRLQRLYIYECVMMMR